MDALADEKTLQWLKYCMVPGIMMCSTAYEQVTAHVSRMNIIVLIDIHELIAPDTLRQQTSADQGNLNDQRFEHILISQFLIDRPSPSPYLLWTWIPSSSSAKTTPFFPKDVA